MKILAVALLVSSSMVYGQQVFRGGVDLVHFGVVVTDKKGEPVIGLKAEDFEVLEQGKAQPVTFFAGGGSGSAPPVHLGFMLDMSGSMTLDIRDVRTSAIKFLGALTNVIDITVVDFDTEVRTARFEADDPRLVERIRSRKPEGWTAFYDALGTYLNGASSQTGEKILVMYTDGGDTRSALRQTELLDLLKSSDVTVYSIGYLEHQGSGRLEQQQILQRFAATTGGQAFFPTRLKEVDKMYEKILGDISARYSLGYMSTNEKMDGRWREVKIRVTRPELKDARVRTRPGYFAPYKTASSR
ncbi:MAG TPA: VWA domain-containing protein [Vicinamibacterales bacterium]|nr:VWA domain-containing protein [Vicinamibacterales bacterium]